MLNHIVTLDDISLTCNSTVRNLEVIFNQDPSFVSQIKLMSESTNFFIYVIIAKLDTLSQNDVEKLVQTFVTSKLDYWNFLLSGCTTKSLRTLQLLQNAADCVLTGTRIRDHYSSSSCLNLPICLPVSIKHKSSPLSFKSAAHTPSSSDFNILDSTAQQLRWCFG